MENDIAPQDDFTGYESDRQDDDHHKLLDTQHEPYTEPREMEEVQTVTQDPIAMLAIMMVSMLKDKKDDNR